MDNVHRQYKVAYLVSHPIQYQAPHVALSCEPADVDLSVYFHSDFYIREYKDSGFGAKIQWDVPLMDGYKYVFLPALGKHRRVTPL